MTAPRINQDERITTAYNIYDKYAEGNLLIHKTTRAGCTTAMGSESLNRHESILMIVPTNNIAQKTIVKDMREYADVKDPHIIHVKSNHNCLINAELCERYPDLKQLPILPLPQSCIGCVNYPHCPITEILRHPEAEAVVLTYSKIVALMMSSGGEKESMGDKVLEAITHRRNVLFDEVHEIQYGKLDSLQIYTTKPDSEQWGGTDKYSGLTGHYPGLYKIVTAMSMSLSEEKIKNTIQELAQGAEGGDHWNKHLARTVNNPWTLEDIGTAKYYKGLHAEIIELTKNRKEFGLNMLDVLDLYKMISIVMSDNISINSIQYDGYVVVNISAIDMMHTEMIKSFVKSIQQANRRLMLTSASICSYDYGKLFRGSEAPLNVLFGEYGDPMKTNDKMTIYADKKKYHASGKYSFWNNKKKIIARTIEIMDKHGDENCIIIAPNKRLSLLFEECLKREHRSHVVTYYKSPEMMGVSNKARVMIAIGIAYKPSNSFDAVTPDYETSQRLNIESVHSDTWQAWSRAKDPNGITESFVYALGVREQTCKDIVTWGFGRNVITSNTNEGEKDTVITLKERNISEPKIITMKPTDKGSHSNMSKTFSQNMAESPNTIYNKDFLPKTVTIKFKSNLLDLLISNTLTFAEQSHDGSYFRVASEISEKLLENHIKGSITIGAYCLNKENEVRNIVFDIDAHPDKSNNTPEALVQAQQKAEQDLIKLQKFLDKVNLPYITEASGSEHSYHVWILVMPVKAMTAKSFGKQIIKDAGIKCEVFPKQASLSKNNAYGNLVKLPFAINKKSGKRSMLQVDGEFKEDWESIEVGIIDISSWEAPEAKPRTRTNTNAPKITAVRPCIEAALQKDLVGQEGHWMRIAITREFFNCGERNPENIAMLFKGQADFDFDFSLEKVMSIIKERYGLWTKQTLQDQCSSFIDCDKCDHFVCKERYE